MRLFAAINLPDTLRGSLWDAAEPLRRGKFPVRWVAPDALHLTLKFLGDVAAEREPEVILGLERAVQGTKPFALHLDGFGVFPSMSRPRVIWAGCDAPAPLELLQHGVEREMEPLGFPLEGRAFQPHLTLGRAERSARPGDFATLAPRLDALAFEGEAVIESLDLMESQLARSGARYTRRRAVPLAG
jgi:RNA 2',3'-cyclic 3'-phosphodiesterase